jgi:hypothetical protein
MPQILTHTSHNFSLQRCRALSEIQDNLNLTCPGHCAYEGWCKLLSKGDAESTIGPTPPDETACPCPADPSGTISTIVISPSSSLHIRITLKPPNPSHFKMHISLCVWAHFKTPKLFSIYFSSILVYSLDRTAKVLVTSINKREFLESLEEGEEIIPDWEKWTLPLSNNTHQFCKLRWAGCKHFLPEKASMSELDLPRDMRINWQWLALPWPGFHTWSSTSFSSHSSQMTGDKNHCRRHDVCYTRRSEAHCPLACAAIRTPSQRCYRSEFALAFPFG